MNADAVAALPWGEYIAKLAATPCLAFREPWSCLNEPEEDGSPEAPMWERDELCPPCLVRAARAALAAARLPSDTPADELDEEREISLVGAEELGHAVAETPWPPVESDAIGETVTGHGAVLLARLHRRGWALVPLAATLDHREQPYGTQEYPKADTMHEELES